MLWPVFVAIDITSTRSHYLLYRLVKTSQKFNNITAEIILGTCINYAEQYLHTYSDTSANEDNSFRNHSLAEFFVSRNVISRRFL
jgi:L-fucose isomerase-like protein